MADMMTFPDTVEEFMEQYKVVDTDGVYMSKGSELVPIFRMRQWFEHLPSAQPEIIRCKDCKYAEYIDDVQTLWCTECGQGRTVAPNDFCSYAERRTNG